MIKIVIADDHKIFRDGLKLLFKKANNICLVGEASNGLELIDVISKVKPDIVMTDIVMPEMNGLGAVEKIRSLYPEISIIVMSMFDEDAMITDLLQGGALCYLLKDSQKHHIIEAINCAIQKKSYYSEAIMNKVIKLTSENKFQAKPLTKSILFNRTELKIIEMLVNEKTSREIADIIFLSPRTVEWYRTKIMEKMKVKSTTGIIVYALRNNIC